MGDAVLRALRLAACAVALGPQLCFAVKKTDAKPDAKVGVEFFEKRIRPVLVAHCYECHSEKSKIVQANLLLDTREGVLRGGDSGPSLVASESKQSLLMEALRQEGLEMPPKGKLPDEVIEDFARWIDMGAPDPRDGKAPIVKGIDLDEGRKFWSYQSPQRAEPPKPKQQRWAKNDIDRYVLTALEAHGLKPSADVDRNTLIRRLSFDLTGLPPSPEENAAFGEDRSETAIEEHVDRLLASTAYGERWGRHWLDVARYAESSGKERNVPYRMAWRYRDYVIDAFNADMPFDQFVREQIAGDLLDHGSQQQRDRQLIATGFLSVGPRSLVANPIVEQYPFDVADEQVDTTTRAFLGSTVGCARCHDHKFDPIPTTDYYAMIGIFRSTENRAGVLPAIREFSYTRVTPLGDSSGSDERARAVAKKIGELEDEGRAIRSEQREAARKKDADRVAALKLREKEHGQRLDMARAEAEDFTDSGPNFAMTVCDSDTIADYAVRIRGDVEDLGATVPRGFMSVLTNDRTPNIPADHSGRLELAEWIASRENPLTARVMVNRVWQHLFGSGLVESVDNFGTLSDRPSHPELLDYLAIRFMDEGWSVKRMVREMVLSRTYQQSSRRDEQAYTVDPDNRWLWRFAPRRLEGEAIRDAILAASGKLDRQRPKGSASLKALNIELTSSARTIATEDSYKYRGVYLPMLRGMVPEMLGLFDMADPSLVTGQREVTSVATQALYLMNSRFVMDQSRWFAERIVQAENLDEAARVDLAWQIALSRLPSDGERQDALDYLATRLKPNEKSSTARVAAWTDVCQSLIGSAEFRYLR